MSLISIWNQQQLTGETPPPPFTIPNDNSAKSLKINNQSRFWLIISRAATSVDVDRIEPFSYLVIPYQPDLSLRIDTSGDAIEASLVSDRQFVDYSTMAGVVSYEKGSTQFTGTPSVNVTGGSVNLEAGASVQIEGTPEFTLAPGTAVEVTGTTNVNIQNTPEVALATGTEVNIAGTPEFTLAPGVSVGIDVNANQIEIVNQPGVLVQNETIGTDIGYGMTRDIGGGVFFAQNTGITSISFAEIVQQVYLQNRGSADVYVTGDEDAAMQSQGVLLSSGDALGLSWRTKNLYIKSTAAQIPVQVQGFY